MKYTVVWLPTVEQALAELWRTASDRRAVTRASDAIDWFLGNDPLGTTTPVDQYYFLRVDPLVVLCEISVDDRMVRVIEIRLLDQNGN